MTENEAQKWLEKFEWDGSEETSEALATICEALQEYPKFRAIGTIEEFKALKEKSVAKKPIGEYTQCKCSVCGRRVRSGRGSSSFVRDNFCQRCGQAIDWE